MQTAARGQHKNPWMVVSEAAQANRTAAANHRLRCAFRTRSATSIMTKKNTVRDHDTWNAQREFWTSAKVNQVTPTTKTGTGVRLFPRYLRIGASRPAYDSKKSAALKKINEIGRASC